MFIKLLEKLVQRKILDKHVSVKLNINVTSVH